MQVGKLQFGGLGTDLEARARQPETGPPGWGLGVGLTTRTVKKISVTYHQQKASDVRKEIRITKRTPKKLLRLGTWNIRTLAVPGASDTVSEEIKKYELEIVALQETRWPQAGKINTKHHVIYYSGCKDGRYYGGVGFAVSKKMADSVIYFEAVNERMCIIRIKGRFKNISMITFYAPTEDAAEEEKDKFYEMLEQRINELPNYDLKLVLGDANAKIGTEGIWREVAGKESLHKDTNGNGERLCNLAAANNLKVMSTWFPRKSIHKGTWISPDGRTCNQIDHVLVDDRNKSSITNVRSIRQAECGSDHFLVLVKMKQRLSLEKKRKDSKVQRVAIENLKDENIFGDYIIKLDNKFQALATGMDNEGDKDIDEEWNSIKKTITETATEVCGESKRTKGNPWFDEDCEKAIKDRSEKKKKWLNSKTNEDRMEYYEINKFTTRLMRRKKREYVKGLLEKAENDQRTNNTKEFFKSIKHFRKGYIPNTYGVKDKEGQILTQKTQVIDRWKEYFQELLNCEQPTQNEEITEYHNVEPWVEEPSQKEVETAIKCLKNNKSPGEDAIASELLKKGGKRIGGIMHNLILRIWREEKIPSDWRKAIVIPIYKKGDKEICGNYRGISLLSNAYKVLSKVIQGRLEQYTKVLIGDHQAGFIKGRSTTDQLFILKEAISKCWEYKKDVHALFIDLSKAYDSLIRGKIWQKMKKFGIPRKLINLVRITVENSKCKVRVDGEISEEFEVGTGVRQGDGLSPLLFNIALEDALQRVRGTNIGVEVGSKVNILAFADDVVILAEDKEDMEELTRIFIRETELMGLRVNDDKTKYMHFTREEQPLDVTVRIDGHVFRKVEHFKYLGVIISDKNSEEREIVNRINLANKCMYACNKFMTSKILSHQTKIKIYKTVIRPILMYGSETWILNKKEEKKLVVFENKVLRKIFGPTKENGEWRIKHNKEIRDQYRENDVVAHVRSGRLRWAGHVLRREQGTLLKEAGCGVPDGRRPPGRPKRRWWDGVRADAGRIGTSMEEAENRGEWRKIVGAAKSQLGHRWPWE